MFYTITMEEGHFYLRALSTILIYGPTYGKGPLKQ